MIANMIAQLKRYAPVFTHGGTAQVAGAAEWAMAEGQSSLAMPAAYVVPLSQDAEANTDLSGLQQLVDERYGVIVAFDNTGDRRGQSVAEVFDHVRASVFKALLNWRSNPTEFGRGFAYAGGEMVGEFNRKQLAYQFSFVIQRVITEGDGWTDPLLGPVAINVSMVDPASGAATASFDVQPET